MTEILSVRRSDLENLENVLFIDVREQSEWNCGHIPGAIHLPLSRLLRGSIEVDLNTGQTIVAYCQIGVRSKTAVKILQQMGIKNIYNLHGGIFMWQGKLENSVAS